jgi:hypothetical protein
MGLGFSKIDLLIIAKKENNMDKELCEDKEI